MWIQHKQDEVITPRRLSGVQPKSIHDPASTIAPPMLFSQQSDSNLTKAIHEVKPPSDKCAFDEMNRTQRKSNSISIENAKNIMPNPSFLFTEELQSFVPSQSKIEQGSSDDIPHSRKHPAKQRKHTAFIFLLLYLLGAMTSGFLYQSLNDVQMQYIAFYLSDFIKSLSNHSWLINCANLYSICFINLTVIALFGVSALGVPLLFIFLFLKGLWNGMLLLQVFTQYHQWAALSCVLTNVACVEVILSTALCLLACSAAKNAYAIFRYISHKQGHTATVKAKHLGIHYLCILAVLAVTCLGCTILVQICFGNFQLR